MQPVCRSCSVSLTSQSFGPNMEKLLNHQATGRLPGQPNDPTQQLLSCSALACCTSEEALWFIFHWKGDLAAIKWEQTSIKRVSAL